MIRKQKFKIEPGDCFELEIKEDLYTYFQFISQDKPMLGSDCIRFFKKISRREIQNESEFKSILNSGTWFYSHTYIGVALKENLYKRIGKFELPPQSELDFVIFRSDPDINFPLRIRKIGQRIEDSIVDIPTYKKNIANSWHDSTMGPLAFRERILLKLENEDYEYLY